MNSKPLCSIEVDEFLEEMDLTAIYSEKKNFELWDEGLNRPGLQLHGYYEYFDAGRIQIMGNVEMSYLLSLDPELRRKRIDHFFSKNFPCLIVCWDLPELDMFVESAQKYNRILLKSKERTTNVFYRLVDYIDSKIAPKTSMHGVLVEVHGVGVVITGQSGIGKSEVALELLKRGNSFIADDVVEITLKHGHALVGEAPEMLRYYMEVRGIGIIDVRMLYGAKSVKSSVEVDMVVQLEKWSDHAPYDRLGLDENNINILGAEVPLVTIPVSGGRNLSDIIETAAINNRMKAVGYHSAKIFCDAVAERNRQESEKREQEEAKEQK